MLLKKYTFAIVSASLLFGSPPAFAWGDTSGTIRSVDRSTRALVLEDGRIFTVVRGINLAKFGEGDHINLHTETETAREIITKMTKGDGPALPGPKKHSRTL